MKKDKESAGEYMNQFLQNYRSLLDGNVKVNYEEFRSIFKFQNEFLALRTFKVLEEKDSPGEISLLSYITAVTELQSPDKKMHFLFKLYDIDGNGSIDIRELFQTLQSCASENSIEFSQEQIQDLTKILMNEFDTRLSGVINYEDFSNHIYANPKILQSFSKSIDKVLLPTVLTEEIPTNCWKRRQGNLMRQKLSLSYIRNNPQTVSFFSTFLIINIVLFMDAALQHTHRHTCYMVARASGQCLNFNSAFAMLLMSRRSIAWMRCNGLSSWLPLDEYVYYHKLTGYFIFIHSLIHTAMHLCNFHDASLQTSTLEYVGNSSSANVSSSLGPSPHFTLYEYLLTTKPQIGWVGGGATLTGWILIAILIVMIFAAQPWIRRSRRFEIFFFTHLLFHPFYFFLILHGPNFWKWFLLPLSLYAMETALRILNYFHRKGNTYVCQAALLPGEVTQLVIRRPEDFHFNPGDYVFLNIPRIAKYEWHPFTISSAPEMNGFLSVHVHSVGQWTNRLYEIFTSLAYNKNIRSASLIIPNYESRITNHESPQPATKPRIRSKSHYVQNLKPTELNELRKLHTLLHPPLENNAFQDGMARGNFNEGFAITEEPENTNQVVSEKEGKACLDSDLKELKEFHNRFSLANSKVIQLAECQIGNNNAEDLQQLSNIMEGKVHYKSSESMPVSIVGPYGSPSSQIFRAEHAVLIGTGIGITPFASILQSIIHRYNEVRSRCPKCGHYWLDRAPSTIMNLKKVDFFWINRNHKAFEWFTSLLKQLELEQSEYPSPEDNQQFLNFYIYVTSLLKTDNVNATFLRMALDLMHQKSKKDITTGLRTKALPGRPNWDEVFDNIEEHRKGKVTVFFCGPPKLGRILRNKCTLKGFTFRKEKF